MTIHPLPLINRPQPEALYSSSGHRTVQRSSNIQGTPHQSSSNSSVNNLEVDEKHFLNEIVKNFNKSIVRNSLEYTGGHRVSTKERNETLPSANHIPRRDTSTESNTVPTLQSSPTHTRASAVGLSSQGAMPKTHYHKSDSAMLNYIFDSHVKLRHSDLRLVVNNN